MGAFPDFDSANNESIRLKLSDIKIEEQLYSKINKK